MDAAEVTWRGAAAARTAFDRARVRLAPPTWTRSRLGHALAATDDLAGVRAALAAGRWDDAHRALSRHFAAAPQRFVVAAATKESVVRRIAAAFPEAAHHARLRADRILDGHYDLLGYRGLRFTRSQRGPIESAAPVDWHFDPIARRRAPAMFWADVPYLDAACGDHKVIWELNRHQHWIALGRAYWLTGEPKYRERVVVELASWLSANPPLIGVNWASMLELALRSISWLWALNQCVTPAEDSAAWVVDLLVALDRQLAHIERNLSYYFSPNTHLLGEALALYVCSRAVPELAASRRREALGRQILLAEIDRQICEDGGHVERSTHYHRYTLDFYSLASIVARLTGDQTARDAFDDAVSRLAFAARLLADDRGRVPHIGDDDGGVLTPITGRPADDLSDSLAIAAALTGRGDLQVGAAPEEACWMLNGLPSANIELRSADAEPMRSSALSQTGYYISRSAAAHMVVDGGPHGYRNGGHAHADALSLTLSVGGRPLLIDPGTACYTIDPALRDRMRSSALHNTVTIDGRSQSAPRGSFHWDHVANARVRAWRANDGFDYFDGSHDGYAPIGHRRRVFMLHRDCLVVADMVDGPGAHSAAAHWHFDPSWAVDIRGSHATLSHGDERVGLIVPAGELERISGDRASGLGWYSPAYGSLEPTTTLRVSHTGSAPFWLISVFDLDRHNAVVDIEPLPVWAEAGAMAHAAAIRIARASSIDYVLIAEPAHSDGAAAHADPRPSSRPTWRVGEIETDARLLFCRTGSDRPIARLALVDGSVVRTPGRGGFLLALPRVASDLHLDFSVDPRLAGAAFGARLVLGGEELPIAIDRRAGPRTRN